MPLKLFTPPASEPIDLATAKTHCRVDPDLTADDAMITSLIATAREYCENAQARSYITQTWDLWIDRWPDRFPYDSLRYYQLPDLQYWKRRNHIFIPRAPLQSVAYVNYYDTDNVMHAMDPGDYYVDTISEPGRVELGFCKIWPPTVLRPANGVNIRFTAGYDDTGALLPQATRQAMLMLIAHWYENRETVLTAARSVNLELQFATDALLAQNKVIVV